MGIIKDFKKFFTKPVPPTSIYTLKKSEVKDVFASLIDDVDDCVITGSAHSIYKNGSKEKVNCIFIELVYDQDKEHEILKEANRCINKFNKLYSDKGFIGEVWTTNRLKSNDYMHYFTSLLGGIILYHPEEFIEESAEKRGYPKYKPVNGYAFYADYL